MAAITRIQEAQQKIQELMKEKQWLQAHRACLEILRFDPENIGIIHLKNKIEKKVKSINRKVIKTDIEKLQPLWKEKKYKDLLLNLKQLEPYINDVPKIKTLILRAEKNYEKEMRVELENDYQNEIKKTGELINEKKFHEALQLAEKLRLAKIHVTELKKLIFSIRTNWINDELVRNKILTEGQKFEDILLFYQSLLLIDPTSEKIKNLITQTKKKYQAYKIDEKKEFIYKSLEEIKTLIQLKKYEKALEACLEVLQYDPANKLALSYKKNLTKKVEKLIQNEVAAQILSTHKKEREEYQKDKKSFIKI